MVTTKIETSAEFFTMDQVLGNDRVNTSPSLAVDNSHGPRRGTIYLTYADNDGRDGADIVIQRSTNGGVSFSAPVLLNAADRSLFAGSRPTTVSHPAGHPGAVRPSEV